MSHFHMEPNLKNRIIIIINYYYYYYIALYFL